MNWYKISTNIISEEDLNKKLKCWIKHNPYMLQLFRDAQVDIDEIDDSLRFEIKELKGEFAKADSDVIALNKKLFENECFFEDHLHFVAHEITHWLHRRAEDEWYFNDTEEFRGFAGAIGWEIFSGKDKKSIYEKFFSIILKHFKNKDSAKKFLDSIYNRALKYLIKNDLI